MQEKNIIESIPVKVKNILIPLGAALIVGGGILSELLRLDSISTFIHPWSFAFYYVWPGIILIGFGVAVLNCNIQLTDKRVRGKAIFGKQVELPLDMVSAVGIGPFKSVSVSTSSGSIRFLLIKNNAEIYEALSALLTERQSTYTTEKQATERSEADELKKYKDLLDSGIITQEEFDAKKKQILGA